MRKIGLAPAAILLMAATLPKKTAPNPDAAFIARAKAVVVSDFFDPSSAQFRNVRVIKAGVGKKVCGEVNGKNRYGGYVGFAAFAFDGNFARVDGPDSSIGDRIMIGECR